ncbi:MAG TPA: flagellar biosynthesis protein FliQ [Pirellulales bacterium]|nr:flagellar biosynthesis protein FliQ [Pirellulales bacterium]
MDPQSAVDLVREAIMMALVVSAPVLIVGMGVGLVVGLLQAVTQIQEQTLSFVPKVVAALAVLTVTMPWVVSRMVEYFRDLVENIPASL